MSESEAKSDPVKITQGDVLRFLASRGYVMSPKCPKCRYEPWDVGFVRPDDLFTITQRETARLGLNVYRFACPHCGFQEIFDTAPLINWMLEQK